MSGTNNDPSVFILRWPDGSVNDIAGSDRLAYESSVNRIQCFSCGTTQEFSTGAAYVQCFSCKKMNAVRYADPGETEVMVGLEVVTMVCAKCSTPNLAPLGARSIRCGTCQEIGSPPPSENESSRPTTERSIRKRRNLFGRRDD